MYAINTSKCMHICIYACAYALINAGYPFTCIFLAFRFLLFSFGSGVCFLFAASCRVGEEQPRREVFLWDGHPHWVSEQLAP